MAEYDSKTIQLFGSIRESDACKGKPLDGIWFRKASTDPHEVRYQVDFISFNPGTVVATDDAPEGTGFNKWLVVLFEEADDGLMDVFYHQICCGDIMYYVNNQMKGGGQGMVMKTSKPGFQAIYDMMKTSPAKGIVQQIQENMAEWEKICKGAPCVT